MSTPLSSTDPKDLARLAGCFNSCVPTGYQNPLKTYLLTQLVNAITGPCVTPTTPSSVGVGQPISNTTLGVRWLQPANTGSFILSYTVKMGTVAGGPYPLTQTVGASIRHVTFSGLTPGTNYYAIVVANSFSGCSSANSAEASGFTGGACSDSRATAWSTQVVVNGGVAPSESTVNALCNFLVALDSAGIYTKMYLLNIFASDSLVAALTPVQCVTTLTPVSLWINHGFVLGDLSVAGLKGDGVAKYLDTGFNMTASNIIGDPGFTENSLGLTVYVSVQPDEAKQTVGAQNTLAQAGADFSLYPNSSGTPFFASYNDGVALITGSAMPSHTTAGYSSGSRTAINLATLYFANSGNAHASKGTTAGAPGAAAGNVPFYVFNTNVYNGSFFAPAAGQYSSARLSFVGFHKGLTATESLAFFNAIQTLRTALGGGFV